MRLPEPGDSFVSKYHLRRVIGAGGFARVFLGEDQAGRAVVVKVLVPESEEYALETIGRFEREVRILGQLRDPHTVRMFESGRSPEGLLYLVCEHVPGEDLSELLERCGRLEPEATVHIMRQILRSLREAHAAGLLHRDIKPENIRVFDYMGDPLSTKLLDFGIAKSPDRQATGSITKTGELVGTPRYMSPEQLMAKPLSAASDIYSLGLVMVEMLLGRESLHGNALNDQIQRLQTGHLLSVPEIERLDRGLLDVLTRMTAHNESQRYGSVDAVLHALDSMGHAMPRAAAASAEPARIRQRWSPRSLLVLVVLLVVILTVAFGASQLLRVSESDVSEVSPPVASRALPPGLLKTSAPEVMAPPATEQPDTGKDLGASHSRGCFTEPLARGAQWMTSTGIVAHRWAAYIPTSYDAQTPTPVVLVATPDHAQPDLFIRQTRLDEVARRKGFLILAPSVGEFKAWRSPEDLLTMREVLDAASQSLCIDKARVFVLGHNNGGYAVERASCEDWVTAVAFSSYRPTTESFLCPNAPPKPSLVLSPLKSGHAPVEGGQNCYGSSKISLDAHERVWVNRNHCRGERKTYFEHAGSECVTYQCDQPFLMCRLDGGQGWPGTAPRVLADWKGCDGTPPDFPSEKIVWDFFESVPPNPHFR